MQHILALDAGGTAVKAAVYDRRGRECGAAGETPRPLTPAPCQNERDPDLLWAAAGRVVRSALARANVHPRDIAAVGLTGYGNGLFLVDRAGTPVRNGVLSSDQRAAQVVEAWRRDGLEAGHVALTHQHLWAGKPLPLLAWLERHEPETLSRATHLLLCKDFLRLRLTGRLGLDVTDASSSSLLDQSGRAWTPAVLDHLGLHRHAHLFGELLEPLTVAGHVTAEAATATGLLAGTPVAAGCADGPAMALALGILDDTRLNVIAGTWGLNQLVTRTPTTDGSILACTLGLRSGEYVLIDGGATSASSFEWFVNTLLRDADGSDRAALYERCSREIAAIDEADPAVYFLPYLNGRLDRPDARGSFIGLSSWHGLHHMGRAIFEGVAMEHRSHVELLLRGRTPPRAARFAGGAARSRTWLDIFAATLQMPIELGSTGELGALGAAVVAAVAVGLHPDLDTAVAAMTSADERVDPDPVRTAVMDRRYRTYRKLCDQLAPVWAEL